MRIVVILVLLSVNVYSQNCYQLLKSGCTKLVVNRTITVKPIQVGLAQKVLERQAKRVVIKAQPEVIMLTGDYSSVVTQPSKVVGGHNYLKMAGQKLESQGFNINGSGGYNGAHHIVTKSVIRELARHKPRIINNAPSVFHPLHADPRYVEVFHDHKRILEVYNSWGVKGVILDFFSRVNKVNELEGLPIYTDDVIETELLEAELWAKYWGLKWE